MQATRILETCVYAEDLEAAEAFYAAVLGLEPFTRVPGRHVFFRCGSAVFLVFNPTQTRVATGDVPTHGAQGQGHVAFGIQAREIPAWKEQLSRNDIAVEVEIYWPNGGQSIYFRDPAGNSVELATPQIWGLVDGE